MAVKNLTLPTFPNFNVNEDVSTLFSSWGKYKKRFGILCTAIGVTDAKQKLSMLLTYIGDESYDIYEQIMPAPEHTLEEVFTAFDNYFKPQVNTSYESYLFHQLKQRTDETISQYYIRLKEQATKCEFHNVDIAIKQQIELSTNNNKLRRYSFQNPGKTLQELLSTGKTYESTKIQTERIEKDSKSAEEDISAVYTPKQHPGNSKFTPRAMTQKPPKTCYYCGGSYPHQGSCPAGGKNMF